MKQRTVALKEIATLIGGVISQDKGDNEKLYYPAVVPNQLTIAGIMGEYGEVRRDSPCNDELFLRTGDVLIKRLNHDCSVVYKGNNGLRVVPSINLFAIRPHDEVDAQYLACMLEKTDLIKQITQLSGGGTTVAAITLSQLGDGMITLPSLDIQQKIGNLWVLTKKREVLLKRYIEENNRLLAATIDQIK